MLQRSLSIKGGSLHKAFSIFRGRKQYHKVSRKVLRLLDQDDISTFYLGPELFFEEVPILAFTLLIIILGRKTVLVAFEDLYALSVCQTVVVVASLHRELRRILHLLCSRILP